MMEFFNTLDRVSALELAVQRWDRTPFRPYCAVPGMGVDCVRLIGVILEECGAIPKIDWDQYPRYKLDWSAHNQREILLEAIEGLGLQYEELSNIDASMPGDVLCFAPGKAVYHLGIYVGNRQFFHAMQGSGARYHRINHPSIQRWYRKTLRPLEMSS